MSIRALEKLVHWPRHAIHALCKDRPDYQAFVRRRTSRGHRARKGHCKVIWIGTGVLMILNPHLPAVVALALTATFLCFALLDERS
jgi:hypothetical protein